MPHRPQRPRRAEGPTSGVAEWEKAGVGRAGYPEEERSGPWVFNEGRLRGRRIGIVGCSGEMGGQQRRGEGRLEEWEAARNVSAYLGVERTRVWSRWQGT